MNSSELMEKIVNLADDKKAEDIRVLDISHLTTMADYFVICHGNSSTQMKAIADEIEEKLKDDGYLPSSKEGFNSAFWILMDYGDVIVHVFSRESREFYGIENLWADAESIDVEKILTKGSH